MKILALRGENLASLQSRFEIDFSTSRLGDAGLFAITGKTGAGKSTLLDAICLALYGGIPRLHANKKHDAEIGRDDDENRIKANDVRSILSRGKGEAFAEVDFLANDGTRWRAHWSVRRARSKAEGRIQTAEQWLENLNTSQRFAGKKQELQDEIQRLIGLSFEQFRRAVMLPQGEFAAFLKAGGDERAALLERMTGGEMYSRISVLAYQRAKAEKDTYQLLQSKLGDVELLSDEAKQTLEQNRTNLEQQSTQISQRLAALKQHQGVLANTEKQKQTAAKAQTAADAAQLALTEAEPRYQHIALLEKVQPARSDFSLLQQAQSQLTKLQRALATSEGELPAKAQSKREADTKVDTADTTLQQAEQDWKALEPDLRAALKLEQQLESQQQQLNEQEQEKRTQQAAAQEQENKLKQLQTQQTELTQRQQGLNEQLAQDSTLPLISEQYDSVQDNLAQFTRAQQAQTALLAAKQKIADEQLMHRQQHTDLITQLEKLTAKKVAHETQITRDDLIALEQLQRQEQTQYETQQQQHNALQQLVYALKEWQAILIQAGKSQAQQTAQQHNLSEMQKNLALLTPKLEILRIRHEECENLVQKSREVMQLSEHRAELTMGEPCPLCGSPDHPFAVQNPLANDLLQTQQQHLKELAADLKRQEAQHAHLEQSIPKEQLQLTACRGELKAFAQQANKRHQHYMATAESLGLAHTLRAQDDRQTLTQQLALREQDISRSTQTLDELKTTNEQRAQQIQTLRSTQDRLLQLQQQENALQTQISTLNQQAAQWQERLQSLDQQYQVQKESLQARTAALRIPFGNDSWQQALHDIGEAAFYTRLEQNVQQYRQNQQTLAELKQQHTVLEPKVAVTQETLGNIHARLEQKHSKIQTLVKQIQALQRQRLALLTEPDLAQLELKHQQMIKVAQRNKAAAQTAQHDAEKELTAIKATLQGMRQQITEATSGLEAIQGRWKDWQQKLALNETELSDRLTPNEDWLARERTALKAIEQNAAAAQVTLAERQQDLLAQEELAEASNIWLTQHAVAENTEQQSQLATDWQQQKDALDEQIFQCRQRLSADEQARTKAGDLTRQLTTQQERYELWEKMNELIGSANGNKFRSLAQSLTLQQLVILANEHLHDLAPRYALQPAPGNGLALQVVDHDMGDEVRSVESLSGGESFLVSLALALGLASLATDTRQLGSLFIDEGFGTLDPDSLEMALACLDALQAEGRQIGVISHVGTLVERIGVQVKVETMGGGRSRVVIAN